MKVEVTKDNIEEILSKSYENPVVLIFSNKYCPACITYNEIFNPLFEGYENIIVGTIDAETEDFLIEKFKVEFYPTTYFIKDDKIIAHIEGQPDIDEFKKGIYLILTEQFDYKKEHGHDKVEIGSVLWYFHNREHGYKHCKGGEKNPYEIFHISGKHGIDKVFARGHGANREPQWFNFVKKLTDELWEVESGEKIDINDVPKRFKHDKGSKE